jgi:hypothetical protein
LWLLLNRLFVTIATLLLSTHAVLIRERNNTVELTWLVIVL